MFNELCVHTEDIAYFTLKMREPMQPLRIPCSVTTPMANNGNVICFTTLHLLVILHLLIERLTYGMFPIVRR